SPGRAAARSHARLAALPAAGTVHSPARPAGLHRAEATLVPAAPDRQRKQLAPRHDPRARVRPLAVGGLVAAGPGSDLLQARRLCPGAAGAGATPVSVRTSAAAV